MNRRQFVCPFFRLVAVLCVGTAGIISEPLVLAASPQATPEEPAADLVVINANLLTVDEAIPIAQAMAIRDERIVAIGTAAEIRRWVGGETQVLDVGGRTIVPGFHDAHMHPSPKYDPLSLLGKIDCSPAATPTMEALIAALAAKAAVTSPGQWVRGGSYQDTKLGRHPTRHDLDLVSTEHPVYISHSSGHVAAVNSLALKLARITQDTQ